jgi:hypothetical protein
MQPQIPLENNKKYAGYTMSSHDYVYQKCIGLSIPEIKGLWGEYKHQFKNEDVPKLKRIEAWIKLQVYTEVLRERGAWNSEERRPMNGAVVHDKTTTGAYGEVDFYTNPVYGWVE